MYLLPKVIIYNFKVLSIISVLFVNLCDKFHVSYANYVMH